MKAATFLKTLTSRLTVRGDASDETSQEGPLDHFRGCPHILETIFGQLQLEDIHNCRLVCTAWKEGIDELVLKGQSRNEYLSQAWMHSPMVREKKQGQPWSLPAGTYIGKTTPNRDVIGMIGNWQLADGKGRFQRHVHFFSISKINSFHKLSVRLREEIPELEPSFDNCAFTQDYFLSILKNHDICVYPRSKEFQYSHKFRVVSEKDNKVKLVRKMENTLAFVVRKGVKSNKMAAALVSNFEEGAQSLIKWKEFEFFEGLEELLDNTAEDSLHVDASRSHIVVSTPKRTLEVHDYTSDKVKLVARLNLTNSWLHRLGPSYIATGEYIIKLDAVKREIPLPKDLQNRMPFLLEAEHAFYRGKDTLYVWQRKDASFRKIQLPSIMAYHFVLEDVVRNRLLVLVSPSSEPGPGVVVFVLDLETFESRVQVLDANAPLQKYQVETGGCCKKDYDGFWSFWKLSDTGIVHVVQPTFFQRFKLEGLYGMKPI